MGAAIKPGLADPAFSGKLQSRTPGDISKARGSQASPESQSTATERYERLRGKHCIRLLTLFPSSNEDDEIVCTLKEHDFDEAIPRFTALSYTWGSEEDPKSILLNGYRADVRSNLHAALTHIRHAESEIIFWIDALCINQQSIEERNQQVPLMRDIYMVAEDVLAWLGPATEGIDPESPHAAYEDVAYRPYWSRVWIIQEFVLGKKVLLQCGHTLYDWEELHESSPSKRERCGGENLRRLLDLKRKFGAERRERRGLEIAEAMMCAQRSEATDPRDKVYGVLGLISRSSISTMLQPDYALSICEVYSQVIKVLTLTPALLMQDLLSPDLKKHETLEQGCGKRCNGVTCGTVDKFESTIQLGR
ncbi:heterokaryon incompatibility protein-domain-containing protein [Phaeosphaeria sp. MPI-PUGE-AT-0046c]|nr:heterokaryon incompatibility protein-domain-containing protein [Phaeosphaeria sp. MPI-PUGE-AT-0046c]